MNTEYFDLPGGDQQEPGAKEKTNDVQENVQVSLPNNDRPEGPFEHSGEVSNWTKEEEGEVTEEQQQ